MNNDNPPDEYEQIDEKAVLMDIAAQLDQIRRLLEREYGTESDESETEGILCENCGTIIHQEDRKSHAKDCFNWHEDMGEGVLTDLYASIND